MVSAKRRGDLFDPDCPTRHMLDAVGDKWTGIVVILLADGPCRFNELARIAEGISYKMLTQTLRRLERDGFATRTVEPTRPPSVTYALTPLGRDLLPVLQMLRTWAETHVGTILAARKRYDRRTAAVA